MKGGMDGRTNERKDEESHRRKEWPGRTYKRKEGKEERNDRKDAQKEGRKEDRTEGRPAGRPGRKEGRKEGLEGGKACKAGKRRKSCTTG